MIVALLACAGPERPTDGPRCEDPGIVCVVAGRQHQPGFSADGLPARDTLLYMPQDVTPTADGGFYVADFNNHVIRRVDAAGVAWVVVGDGWPNGGTEGVAVEQSIKFPTGVVVDPVDPEVAWLALSGLHQVGRLEDGLLELPYGIPSAGYAGDGGPVVFAQFAHPSSLAFDDEGALYVSDRMNQVVRRIARGTIDTVVGTPLVEGYAGDGGPASEALLSAPPAARLDPGNRLAIDGDRLWIADTGNHVVRVVDLATFTIDTVADGLLSPYDVAVGPDGTVYVADTGHACVRALEPGGGTAVVAGVCGEPGDLSEGSDATEARFRAPVGIAVDDRGGLWIADAALHLVARVAEVGAP